MEPVESPEAVEAVEAVDVSWLHHSSGQSMFSLLLEYAALFTNSFALRQTRAD